MNKNRQSGFTLVELIVVIAILGILAGVGTVAYTGYVEKANKAVDQQLVADIEYAMQLAGVSGDFGETSGMVGYVSLTTNGATAGEAVTGKTYIDDALKAAFGDNYATTLGLKYGKWTDAATMLNEVSNNSYAASVNQSGYIQAIGTEKLLGDVQTCTTALGSFLTALTGGGNETAAYDLLKIVCPDLGDYTDRDTATKASLENAAVLSVANWVNTNENRETVAKQFYDGNSLILNNTITEATFSGSGTVLSNTATWYAALEALVAYLDDEDVTNEFDKITAGNNLESSGSKDAVLQKMSDGYTNVINKISEKATGGDPALGEKFEAYYNNTNADGKSQAQLDGEAYAAIMSTVGNISDDYAKTDALHTSGLFQSAEIANRLNSYIAAASVVNYADEILNGIGSGAAVIVIVTADGKGITSCTVLPDEAAA